MYKALCPAKINLSLRILGKDKKTGYHFLESFIKKIDFSDEIEISFNEKIDFVKVKFSYGDWFLQNNYEDFLDELDILQENYNYYLISVNFLDCNRIFFDKSSKKIELLDEQNNLLIKAIKFFEKYSGIMVKNLEISCKKNIPYGSGLGGGSSNAAEILKFLQKQYNFYFSEKILQKIPLELGADISLFLENDKKDKVLLIEGFGEKITKVKLGNFEKFGVLIFFPYKKFNTGLMYKRFKEKDKFDVSNLTDPSSEIFSGYNSFYNVLNENEKKEIDFFLEKTRGLEGFVSCGLSGSGSACFAIFENLELANDAKNDILKITNGFLQTCKFV